MYLYFAGKPANNNNNENRSGRKVDTFKEIIDTLETVCVPSYCEKNARSGEARAFDDDQMRMAYTDALNSDLLARQVTGGLIQEQSVMN